MSAGSLPRSPRAGALALVSIATLGVAGLRVHADERAAAERRAAREQERAALEREVEGLEKFSGVFRRVAALARPSVVHVEMRIERPVQWNPFFGPQQGGVESGTGTGVILSEKGAVLTNNHVAGAEGAQITVRLHDGRSFKATVKGRDPKSDLAVLQLVSPPDDLEPAVLGESDKVSVGDWVIAVGNPFGLDETVTAGIVSAIGRAGVGVTEYEDFIQTDAAINPGNSGGPLLDLRGRVVGINTAIASRTGGYQGIGFAIPIDMAREVARQLEERGRVVRGWLGVAIQETPGQKGARVTEATPGGPADKAGLAAGDVITAIDGRPVASVQKLRNVVARAGAGKKVKVELVRDDATRTVEVELGELPDDPRAALRPVAPQPQPFQPDPAPRTQEQPSGLGIEARPLSPELAGRLGWPEDAKGIVITQVDRGSLAAMGGVRPGLLLREIDRRPIESMKDLDVAVTNLDPARGVLLLLEAPNGAKQHVLLRRG